MANVFDNWTESYVEGLKLKSALETAQRQNEVARQNANLSGLLIQEKIADMKQKRADALKAEETRQKMMGWGERPKQDLTMPITPPDAQYGVPGDVTYQVEGPSKWEQMLGANGNAIGNVISGLPQPEKVLGEILPKLIPTERTPMTLENVLAEKVRRGEMTLQEAIAAKSQGTVSTDLTKTWEAREQYRKMGLPEDHPLIKALDQKLAGGGTATPQLIGHTPDWKPVVWDGKNQTVNGVPYVGKVIARTESAPIPGSGGFGAMPTDQQDIWYDTYAKTKQLPPFAYRDAEGRSQFIKGYAQWLQRQGMTPSDAILSRVETDALSGSLKNQEKVFGMMGGFVRNLNKQVDRVSEIGNDIVKRVGVRAMDLPFRELKTRFIGSGAENVLGAYTLEISNEIGKLSTGSSGSIRELSVEAQKIWAKIHDPNLSLNELKKVLLETKQMANMRLDSSKEEINETKKRIKGVGGETPSTPANPSKNSITLKSGKVIQVED